MSEQTRRAFIRHFVRALSVGNQKTIAAYLAEAKNEPGLLDELTAIQQATQAHAA